MSGTVGALSPQTKALFQCKKWSHFPQIGQAHIPGSSPLYSCGTSVVEETLFLWGPLVAGIPANMRLTGAGSRVLARGCGGPGVKKLLFNH